MNSNICLWCKKIYKDNSEEECNNLCKHKKYELLDFISDNPQVVRVLALRSFGESLHHSLTDACLEFGFKSV